MKLNTDANIVMEFVELSNVVLKQETKKKCMCLTGAIVLYTYTVFRINS